MTVFTTILFSVSQEGFLGQGSFLWVAETYIVVLRMGFQIVFDSALWVANYQRLRTVVKAHVLLVRSGVRD